MNDVPERTDWWGEIEVPPGHGISSRVGPMEFTVARLPLEWRVTWQTDEDPLDNQLRLGGVVPLGDLPVLPHTLRVGDPSDDWTFELRPALADRPVVSRAEAPFSVLPGDQATIFVSIPLWICGAADAGRPLFELPLYRPSDTWFGPSTRAGELCYASRTNAGSG